MCSAEALPEADSAPTWLARFSIGSGNIGRVERCRRFVLAADASRDRYVFPPWDTRLSAATTRRSNRFRGVFFKIRRALDTTAFGINELRMPAGFEGPEHDEVETGHEEVYIVLEGGGTFTSTARPSRSPEATISASTRRRNARWWQGPAA